MKNVTEMHDYTSLKTITASLRGTSVLVQPFALPIEQEFAVCCELLFCIIRLLQVLAYCLSHAIKRFMVFSTCCRSVSKGLGIKAF